MYQQLEIPRNQFTDGEIQILKIKHLDYILINSKILTKNKIIERLRNLRDELDRWG